MRHYGDFESYYEHIELKRKAINEHAIEQYEKNGTLSSSVLLEESEELDTLLSRQFFEERMAQVVKEREQNIVSKEPDNE